MSDSYFLRNETCIHCRRMGRDRSGNNLGIFNDHEYCWSCGYYKSYNPIEQRRTAQTPKPIRTLYLPDDIVTTVPYEAHEWLLKYGLTAKELIDNRVVWSESKKLLIFLYVEDTILRGWQGRYFGTDKSKPKWWSQGDLRKINYILGKNKINDTGSIILVEDIVSSIKLSRYYCSKPLFGSYIDIVNIYKLYKEYKLNNIVIWLDDDKYKEAHQFAIKLSSLGVKTRVIKTKLDPKLYTNEQIKVIYESKVTIT